MSAEFTVAARALGRGSGTQGELTLSKAIGARFRAATGAGEQKKTEIEAGKVREVRWSDAPTGGVLRVRSTDGRTLVLGGMGTEDAKNAAEYAARERRDEDERERTELGRRRDRGERDGV